MNSSSHQFKAYLAVFIGILSVSASAILVRLATASPGITAFYRLFFTLALMIPLLPKFRAQFKKMTIKPLLWTAVSGVCLAWHFILWFHSLELTSVASSVVLVTLQPLFAFIGSFFIFNERYRIGAVFGAGLSILGSLLISWGDMQVSHSALLGDLLALAACLAVTGYFLIGQALRKSMTLFVYTFCVYFFATLTLLIYNLVLREQFWGFQNTNWLLFVLLAIFPTLLGHTLFNWAVKWVGVTTISMSILGEPIGASILAYFIFHELLRPLQIAGSLIILFGIGLYLIFQRKTSPETTHKEPSDLHPKKVG